MASSQTGLLANFLYNEFDEGNNADDEQTDLNDVCFYSVQVRHDFLPKRVQTLRKNRYKCLVRSYDVGGRKEVSHRKNPVSTPINGDPLNNQMFTLCKKRRVSALHFPVANAWRRSVISFGVAVRKCTVSFTGPSGISHAVEVEADTLYEAVVLATCRFRQDIWGEAVANGTSLEVEVREPGTKHSLTLRQVERWLAAPGSPYEAARKAKLKLMLVQSA